MLPEWLDKMQQTPGSMTFTGFQVFDKITPRLPWPRHPRNPRKQIRHHAPNAVWPPKGIHLRMDYALNSKPAISDEITQVNRRLYESNMTSKDKGWRIHESKSHPRSSFENEGKFGEIYTPHNSVVFADRNLPEGTEVVEIDLSTGTDDSASWAPGIGLVWKRSAGNHNLEHAVKFTVRTSQDAYGFSDGRSEKLINGREKAESYRLRMVIEDQQVSCYAKPAGKPWKRIGTIATPAGKPEALRVGKMDIHAGRTDHRSANAKAALSRCKINEVILFGGPDEQKKRHLNLLRRLD